jgi:hypothetical protein
MHVSYLFVGASDGHELSKTLSAQSTRADNDSAKHKSLGLEENS